MLFVISTGELSFMTLKSIGDSSHCARQHAPDPNFYYRVDSLRNLHALHRETIFKARRWDGVHHASLHAAATGKSVAQGIFRICFWNREEEGRAALGLFSRGSPNALLRVRRAVVRSAFAGWNFDEDDALSSGHADMIWSVQPTAEDESLSMQGIPLEAVEVLHPNGTWQRWIEAEQLLPARARLARIGWLPVVVIGRNQQAVVCHWYVTTIPEHRDAGLWCLVALDENCRQTLRDDTGALGRLAHILLDGPLVGVDGCLVGIAVVNITSAASPILIDQYLVDPRPRRSRWRSIVACLRSSPSSHVRDVERRRILSSQELQIMIQESGLRHAIATSDVAWQSLQA
jgi:hypothetical protein